MAGLPASCPGSDKGLGGKGDGIGKVGGVTAAGGPPGVFASEQLAPIAQSSERGEASLRALDARLRTVESQVVSLVDQSASGAEGGSMGAWDADLHELLRACTGRRRPPHSYGCASFTFQQYVDHYGSTSVASRMWLISYDA